jgi:hypothetical protein
MRSGVRTQTQRINVQRFAHRRVGFLNDVPFFWDILTVQNGVNPPSN